MPRSMHVLSAGFLLCISMQFSALGQTVQQPGTWKNVTPQGIDTTSPGGGYPGYFGAQSVSADPARPSDVYVGINLNGVYKSTDYGVTWKKVNTGTNGDQLQGGYFWSLPLDPNPKRDPNTPPVMYTNQGWGSGGIWKSTDGGVDWTNVWTNNIYDPDGVTNISADVGADCAAASLLGSSDANHLVLFLHSYWGTGNNNGVFRTDNGGATWMVYKTSLVPFEPHSDIFSVIDSMIWQIVPGINSSTGDTSYRSTDGGLSWSIASIHSPHSIGQVMAEAGSTIYSASDFQGGVYKTTDKGATWSQVPTPVGQIGWVAATASRIYASSGGMYNTTNPIIINAPLTNDTKWIADTIPTIGDGAFAPAVTFDGTHYIVIADMQQGGLWRYVEPAPAVSVRQVDPGKETTTMLSNLRVEASPVNHGFMITAPLETRWHLELIAPNGKIIAHVNGMGCGSAFLTQDLRLSNKILIARLETTRGECIGKTVGNIQ